MLFRSPTFTHVYAALAAIINTKFPNIGELLLKRLILNFKRGFKRNDKTRCTSSVRFIGHMVNQQVGHEVLALEILTLLLENPTDDSAEVAITFLKEVGQKLTEVSPRGIHAIFERLRHVLHESTLDKRTQYMIEVMFQVRKDGFKDNPAVPEELDLVEREDQVTFELGLDDKVDKEETLDVFKVDDDFDEHEKAWDEIKREILSITSGESWEQGPEGAEARPAQAKLTRSPSCPRLYSSLSLSTAALGFMFVGLTPAPDARAARPVSMDFLHVSMHVSNFFCSKWTAARLL